MVIKNLTSANFDEFFAKSKIIVDFYADWCGPCKIIGPIMEELSDEVKDVKFGKVNVDKESDLAQRFNVMSVPTLIFFKNKKQIERTTGVISKDEFKEVIGKTF